MTCAQFGTAAQLGAPGAGFRHDLRPVRPTETALHPRDKLLKMHEAEQRARELAAETGGALSRDAARAVKFSGSLLVRRLRSGEWSAPTARVLVLTGTPRTFDRDAWIGLYEAGASAAITTETALAKWRVPGFSLRPIQIAHERARNTTEIEGVVFHRPRLWPDHHRMLLNDVPTVTPTRALFDLVNDIDVHPKRAERAINNAWARGLTSGELLQKMADEWLQRGRRGSAFLREYLSTRPIDWQPPESNLEARFVQLIVDAGMPEPKRQRNIGDDVSWIGRIDMRDPELPLVGEIDSDLFHTAPLDVAADELRDERLAATGIRVERFTEAQIWRDPAGVVERWRRARLNAKHGSVGS